MQAKRQEDGVERVLRAGAEGSLSFKYSADGTLASWREVGAGNECGKGVRVRGGSGGKESICEFYKKKLGVVGEKKESAGSFRGRGCGGKTSKSATHPQGEEAGVRDR